MHVFESFFLKRQPIKTHQILLHDLKKKGVGVGDIIIRAKEERNERRVKASERGGRNGGTPRNANVHGLWNDTRQESRRLGTRGIGKKTDEEFVNQDDDQDDDDQDGQSPSPVIGSISYEDY